MHRSSFDSTNPAAAVMTSPTSTSSPDAPATGGSGPSGVAGRINYAEWDKVASKLVDETAKEEEEEIAREKASLGLDGKYARSEAEAREREKLKAAKETKKTLEKYKKREAAIIQNLSGLLGPIVDKEGKVEESKATETKTVRITRDNLEAGNRVLTVCDTSGSSVKDTIVMTQDLSSLESKMKANALAPTKSFADDAENKVEPLQQDERSVFGLIKLFVSNVHNCTILIKCKIISGVVELHECSNVVIRVESTATVATIQADLSEDITIEFRDAPSGKNVPGLPGSQTMYWGEDADDRIYHAGVKNMTARVIRDGMVETETTADYVKDGAVAVGNATAEEVQFITSVVNGDLVTERVMRAGSTTGKNARAMTQRELDEEKARREKAAAMAIKMADDMIQIKDKDGNVLASKKDVVNLEAFRGDDNGDDEIEEVFASMSKEEIKLIVDECEQNKARGNEAFGAGEYGQAILLYSLALDKAEELPDASSDEKTKLFPRDVVFSNRSACFLKLGQHEKAEEDARNALMINPKNLKANFRRGLALHAMGRYRDALPVLAEAHKIEPKNKQVKQALQFCEVRLAQEERKRMES